MKKMMLPLMLLLSVITGALAQKDVMYVYRNDGVINAFPKSKVDSISCSHLDVDSVCHNEFVVQEIFTEDSIYRIPLEMIDSVSFVTPETVYQPHTIAMTAEMREHVIGSDVLSLVFDMNTPEELLPKTNDKLVNTEGSGGLKSGFLGQVKSVFLGKDGYVVECDPIDLTDVFECYYGIGFEQEESQFNPTRSISDGYHDMNFDWNPGTISLNMLDNFGVGISWQPDDNLLIPSLDEIYDQVNITPRLQSFSYLIINREYGVNLSIGLYGDYAYSEEFRMSGSINGGGDIKFIDASIPVPEALMDVNVEVGAFVRGAIQIATEQAWQTHYKWVFHYEWSSKGQSSLKNVSEIIPLVHTHNGIIALSGNYDVGFYVKPGIAFICTSQLDIAEMGIRLEGGVHFEGTAVPYIHNPEDAMKTTDLYKMLQGKGVKMSWFYGTSFDAELFSWGYNKPIPNVMGIPFGKKGEIKSIYYVPDFSDTKLQQNEDGSLYATSKVQGRVPKTDVGFSLQRVDYPADCVNGYSTFDYTGPSASLYSTFYQKPSKAPYIVYPMVKFGDIEMIAEPSAKLQEGEMCPDGNHVHAIDLGLPSGTKWACCNVGASSPEEYGDYYAWGETETKDYYDLDTYKWCKGSWPYMTKYTYVDNKTVLDPEDDAAHVKWGGKWRMPTKAEMKELREKCTWTWTTQGGKNGYKVTGPSRNSIFLPAAGGCGGGDVYGQGRLGNYRSSTPDGNDLACILGFNSGSQLVNFSSRYGGASVRAVLAE